MKFDFVIGNPPYQDDKDDNSRKPPVYNLFMDEAYKIGKSVELITPARFLFDAGQTPKKWNEKMLNDEHLKVLHFEDDGSKVFPNTDIKGGVAITYRDENKEFGKIGFFTIYNELNGIVKKVKNKGFTPLSDYAYPKSTYSLSEILYNDYPNLKKRLTKGNQYIIDANIFSKMPEVFLNTPDDTNNYIKVFGRQNNTRTIKWINKKYIKHNKQLDFWKVLIPGANGTGTFGETLSCPEIAEPNSCYTQTYMSIGAFLSEFEAISCSKYIKTKFLRALLGTLKVTQNNPKDCWSNIPMLNFKEEPDIDWSKSVHEIDLQLYRKYGLSVEEIDFIEKNVKEMV